MAVMLMDFIKLASSVGQALIERSWQIVIAESCTGGWLAQVLTSIPGASAFFDRGFVTYSNEAKMDLLGVSAETLDKFGAVSEQTVTEMAQGALKCSQAQVAVAITGLAGPGGGSEAKPIGTIWFGIASQNKPVLTRCEHLSGDRESIRKQAVQFALNILINEYL